MTFLTAGKNTEAAFKFRAFIQRHKTHPLTGSAQFHLGKAFYKQGKLAQAIPEFRKVLSHYGGSIHVSDALGQLAISELKQNNRTEAARYRELLVTLFPQSSAAGDIAGLSFTPYDPTRSERKVP